MAGIAIMELINENIWCPYSGKIISTQQASTEHIIPLALGGANDFKIMVDGGVNSKVGSEIDGVLAKDLLIAMKRQEFDAVGHSKKRPEATIKRASLVFNWTTDSGVF